MTCRDLERLLAEGKPLSPEAEKHLESCPGCRALLGAFSQPDAGDRFDGERLRSTIGGLLAGLTPVKPLPSDSALVSITMGIFLAFTLLIALVMGLGGYAAMTAGQRFAYYTVVLVVGLLFSIATVAIAIPGSKVRVSNGRLILGSLVALAWIVSALFREFTLDNFVSRGIPCLRLGCICAAFFGLVATLLLRRAYVTRVRATALLIGCFAGFSGVAVLSLHCPLQNASHIIVWHLGAVLVSAAVGTGIGWFIQRRPDPEESATAE